MYAQAEKPRENKGKMVTLKNGNQRGINKCLDQIGIRTNNATKCNIPMQLYDFTQHLVNENWAGLFYYMQQEVMRFGGIFDVDLDHIVQRHLNPMVLNATQFIGTPEQVLRLIRRALANPTVTWVGQNSIRVEYDTGAVIGTQNETRIRLFISTAAMDRRRGWGDAWVTTAYPI